MKLQAGQEAINRALAEIEETLTEALDAATKVVKFKVMDLTPRWKGGLVKGIKTEVNGREGRVYGEGVVMRVMEDSPHATWSKVPPHAPIKLWVEGKLGFSGKKADSVAWAIQHRIKEKGMRIPNKEGRGAMFARTFQIVQSTNLHWHAFMAKMRKLESR